MMKQKFKSTRRRNVRRWREAALMPVRAPRPAPRDMVAYAAALEILG
jgi:hypothetical protein